MEDTQSAKFVLEVTAGLVPGTALPELSRRIWCTSDDWYAAIEADTAANLLAEKNKEALDYGASLMMSPDKLNWVQIYWLWF